LLALEELLDGEDKYALQRDAYLDRRQFLINDGEVEDDFGGEEYDTDFDDIQF
jgi:ABC-type transporter lipoprotein component MlaA